MNVAHRFLRVWVLGGLLAALLTGCATGPAPRQAPSALPYPGAARSDPLAGAEAAFARGDLAVTRAHLAALADHSVPVAQMQRLQLLRARLAAAEGRDADVLRLLPMAPEGVEMGAATEALRAEARSRLGDPVGAVQAWVARLAFLDDPRAVADNRMRLWQGLSAASIGIDDRQRAAAAGFVVEGWIALAEALRAADRDSALAAWRSQFGPHPAAAWMAQGGLQASPTSDDRAALQFAVHDGRPQWAVLLPLSGPLAASGTAIRDGLLSAYLGRQLRVPIRFHDTGGTPGGAALAFQDALREGATLVIGPLRKESVSALLAGGRPPVPLLALNQVEPVPGAPMPANVVQFALAPEDEARAAARHARRQGLGSAVVLVPEGDWGNRVEAAFIDTLEAAGGAVVGRARYTPGTADFSLPIKQLLRVTDSERRYQELAAVLGQRPVFDVRRRGDADMVFFAGRPVDGRQIWSQFRFHHAQGLAAYSTALIHQPGGGGDSDLVGTRFCDQPWLLDDLRDPQFASATRGLSSRQAQPRLFALGADALSLAQRISDGAFDAVPLEGLTGDLTVTHDGRVERGLGCARFTRSGLERLPLSSDMPEWSSAPLPR